MVFNEGVANLKIFHVSDMVLKQILSVKIKKIFFLFFLLSSTGKVSPPDKYHPSWHAIGDPTEASFATLAMKAGFTLKEIERDYPPVKSFGFDSFRKRAAIIRTHQQKVISSVKGSIETILDASTKIIVDGKVNELTDIQ